MCCSIPKPPLLTSAASAASKSPPRITRRDFDRHSKRIVPLSDVCHGRVGRVPAAKTFSPLSTTPPQSQPLPKPPPPPAPTSILSFQASDYSPTEIISPPPKIPPLQCTSAPPAQTRPPPPMCPSSPPPHPPHGPHTAPP